MYLFEDDFEDGSEDGTEDDTLCRDPKAQPSDNNPLWPGETSNLVSRSSEHKQLKII